MDRSLRRLGRVSAVDYGGRRLRARPFALLFLALLTSLAIGPPAATAQEGAVAGRVVDQASGEPVVSATVSLPALDRSAVTNDRGNFRLTDVPPGRHELRIRHIRYGDRTVPVQVTSGEILTRTFRLAAEAIEVEPLEVTVYHPDLVGTGFYERMNDERGGHFMTPDTLDQPKYEQKSLDQILRATPEAFFRGVGSGGCVRYFLDGRPLGWYGIPPEELYSFDLSGIEVLGPGEAPLEYYRGDVDPTRCSVVLVWRAGASRNR